MRGVASQGMMISADELALPPEWFEDGIMQLDDSIAAGIDVVELFGLDTAVLDVEITANRADSMSVVGLARELAASYGLELRAPSPENPGRARASERRRARRRDRLARLPALRRPALRGLARRAGPCVDAGAARAGGTAPHQQRG